MDSITVIGSKDGFRRPVLAALFFILSLLAPTAVLAQQHHMLKIRGHWCGTWATAQQVPVKAFMPYNNQMTNRSVRQIVKASVGGTIVRLKLSNELSNQPVVINSIYIAQAADSFRIHPETSRTLDFNHHRQVTIYPGQVVYSDAEYFPLNANERVAITVNYEEAPKQPTVHMGSRTTSYILKGYSTPHSDFSRSFRYEKWFNIAALEVFEENAYSVAILGNSITDGKGSTTNRQNRWPDIMSDVLNASSVHARLGVLNLGIGNNRVLSVGYGTPAKERFDRDILAQHGLRYVIVFEGINDLGNTNNGIATAYGLIEAYKEMIKKAHARGLRIFGATITPMQGAAYFTGTREAGRQLVNTWIRHVGNFDGVIDFDKLMRDPKDELAMRREWSLPDRLHPNAKGYAEMGRYAADFILKEIREKPAATKK